MNSGMKCSTDRASESDLWFMEENKRGNVVDTANGPVKIHTFLTLFATWWGHVATATEEM